MKIAKLKAPSTENILLTSHCKVMINVMTLTIYINYIDYTTIEKQTENKGKSGDRKSVV